MRTAVLGEGKLAAAVVAFLLTLGSAAAQELPTLHVFTLDQVEAAIETAKRAEHPDDVLALSAVREKLLQRGPDKPVGFEAVEEVPTSTLRSFFPACFDGQPIDLLATDAKQKLADRQQCMVTEGAKAAAIRRAKAELDRREPLRNDGECQPWEEYQKPLPADCIRKPSGLFDVGNPLWDDEHPMAAMGAIGAMALAALVLAATVLALLLGWLVRVFRWAARL